MKLGRRAVNMLILLFHEMGLVTTFSAIASKDTIREAIEATLIEQVKAGSVTKDVLKKLPNVGKNTIWEVEDFLGCNGLELPSLPTPVVIRSTEASDRAEKADRLHRKGMTYAEVGKVMNVSAGRARQLAMRSVRARADQKAKYEAISALYHQTAEEERALRLGKTIEQMRKDDAAEREKRHIAETLRQSEQAASRQKERQEQLEWRQARQEWLAKEDDVLNSIWDRDSAQWTDGSKAVH